MSKGNVNPKILQMFRDFNAPVHKAMDEMKEIVRATRSNSKDNMETFLERLEKESEELREKIDKLNKFIKSKSTGVSNIQRSLLTVQLTSMVSYHACLEERLNDLHNNPPEEKETYLVD